uniref:Anaphase-promoting complex subunit 4 n=1 Tax=Hucho hucho TaxID=62062 RepID=A0A4W5KEW8_9TELE
MCHILWLSGDLKSLFIITEITSADNDPEICYIQLNTGVLSHCLPEVTRMAHSSPTSPLLQYLHLSLSPVCVRLGRISSCRWLFASLSSFSPELQALLMNQLTVKLKKLGQSIETSYSSIQKLVISHLQSGSEALKDNKFLQVIDKSMKNFKAFFRWLCVAMLRMSEDHVPPELNKNERAV